MKLNTYTQEFPYNIKLAYPVMLSQLGHVMVGVADSMMVGQLGAIPLAAAALGNVIFHLLLTFGIGVSYAMTPFVAAADGENDPKKVISFFKNGFVINVVTGIGLAIIVYLGSFTLPYLNQPEDVVSAAIPYLQIIGASIFPVLLFQTTRQFAEGLSHTRQAMYISVAGNLINILLNYILIFGKFGAPALGLIGAGIATLISRWLIAAGMWTWMLKSKYFKPHFLYYKASKITSELLNKLSKVGFPAGFQFLFEVSAFGFAAIMMGWLGAIPLAAHQIAINLAAITYMAASGLSAAATIRVGNQYGRKDIPMLRIVGFSMFLMVVIFMGTNAVLFIAARNWLPTLYISDPEVIAMAAGLLIWAAIFQLSDGVQVVGLGALRGLADVKIPTYFTFLAYWVIGIPIGYTLGFGFDMGATGIWIGLFLGLTVAAVFLFRRFNILTNKMKLTIGEHRYTAEKKI